MPDGITCASFCDEKEAELERIGCTKEGTALIACLGKDDNQCMLPNDACAPEKAVFEQCAKRALFQGGDASRAPIQTERDAMKI